MAQLKIVTGGTTGAADGTLVSSAGGTDPIPFVDVSPAYVTAHMRCTDDFYSADQVFTLPSSLEVSFDGGSTWHGSSENPISAPEVADLNVAFRLRQLAPAVSAPATFDTFGSYTAVSALADVTNFWATRSASGTQVDLQWSAVTNRTYYQIQRATDAAFTANLTTLTSTLTATTYSDTGRTAGTTYYYRIKAIGTGHYGDSPDWVTFAAYPQGVTFFSFSAVDAQPFQAVEGPDGNMWVTLNGAGTNKIARVTPTGTIDEFSPPAGVSALRDICVVGSNIWYAAASGHVVKISTFSGTPTQTAYSITAAYGCCAGPDGNLYVTDASNNVRKVNPADGSTTATYTQSGGSSFRFICTDGTDLFLTDFNYPSTGALVKMTTSGTFTRYAMPDSASDPVGICWDSASSRLYIAGQGTGKIYKVTTGGSFTSYTVNASSQITDVAVGPDGRIYTDGYNASFKNIYSIPSGGGTVTSDGALSAGTGTWGVAVHKTDSLWVCEYGATIGKIARYVR